MKNVLGLFNLIRCELVYGAHFTALGSPSLVLMVSYLVNEPINIFGLIIAYLISLTVYTFNYYSELEEDIITNPEKVSYLRRREKYFPYIIGSYILLILALLAITFNIGFIIFVSIILVGGLLYTVVFKVLTKHILGFKSTYITMIWAYAATFFIIAFNSLGFDIIYLYIFLLIFLKIFINVVFFDIKDIKVDKIKSLKTIPLFMGKDNAIKLLNIINVLSLIFIIYSVYIGIFPVYMLSFVIFFAFTFYYLNKGKNANDKQLLKYSYFLADAEFVLWPIVFFISKIIFIKFF